ncbi:GAP family protein [Mycolicibacterium thermoresistibile]|uniref:Gap protein n=2 Tax=Mycolicibacterium thermoresistibile TaxID=1797 RepID=G7CAS2_MYCT3|nr:GAP family protein [Mycolicibacterium thermoresistibile]EHI14952.1 hypothetical protein KEK_00320 [Mycolicibacterium thermoresistibile ATCC 19527]MCV7188498.1 GAP family protein [Mycolicibacterium thermoresistibile]GAT17415.1 putative uncharacterized protein [Mycolicibacterium thermoresistibile]
MFGTMWGAVVLFALMAMGEPLRIGAAVLLISRPRPMFNLFLFWLGGIVATVLAGVVVLFLLRDVIGVVTAAAAASGSAIDIMSIQIAVGALALALAPVILLRSAARRKAAAPVGGPDWPTGRGPSVDSSDAPSAFSRLSARVQGVLQGGSPWVAFFIGAWLGPGPPVELVAALTAIVASGATAGTQVGAVVVFALVMFAFAEIPLISHLVAPTRTEAVMMRLHTWVRVHRGRVFAVGLAVLGGYLLGTGLTG